MPFKGIVLGGGRMSAGVWGGGGREREGEVFSRNLINLLLLRIQELGKRTKRRRRDFQKESD